MKSFNILKLPIFLILCVFLTISCSEKGSDKPSSADAFVTAKEAYNDGLYEIAIQKLSAYKSKYPYSKFAVEADLLIADCHYQLGNYEEAAISYKHFIRLHPKHPKVEMSLYRVGESYWNEAPGDIDREQEYTKRAMKEWNLLLSRYPGGKYAKEAKAKVKIGKKRIAANQVFIGSFYCKQEIYHACAYRFLEIAQKYKEFPDIYKVSVEKLYISFRELAKIKGKSPDSDTNLF